MSVAAFIEHQVIAVDEAWRRAHLSKAKLALAVMFRSWHNAGLHSSDGEIGRHWRLKISRRKACRFDSGSEHHLPVRLGPPKSARDELSL